MSYRLSLVLTLVLVACGDGSVSEDVSGPAGPTDPGTGAWERVSRDRVAEECGLDPDLLEQVDRDLDRPWAIVRHGKLCHEFQPSGVDESTEVFSVTKTLGAVVTGVAAYRTADLPRSGRKTGPLRDADRIDHWIDDFSFNPDALVAHSLAMLSHNEDLSYGNRRFFYDGPGTVHLNRLSDVLNAAIDQDPAGLGADLDEFTQRFLFEPLGMRGSAWSNGAPNKIFGISWRATTDDMAPRR